MLIRQLPSGSAMHRHTDPEGSIWGLAEQLAAAQLDALRGANWQRGGGKGQKPKPLARPGVGPKRDRFGTASFTPAEMRARLRERWAMSEDEEVG